ncbi:amino acid ABC transporter permease [Salinicola rhizosphaerae]|uniref:Polar amino acid ABC transporter permease n=1 Tax=Salinicola rhizosphaerae TaxID=1443141 RepID=A0ABQ3E1W8_9GAMM|nr:amino acid ABC transporter permease [Salinicola rhizosphaerae]GHB17094.1 polar amino acid ABC transporter permease [Salinicola rhizosphaerae]
MNGFLNTFFNLDIMAAIYPMLLNGLKETLLLSVMIVPLGVGVGLLIACARAAGNRWLNLFLTIYVDFFRSFASLVLLILIYYGLPFFGIEIGTRSAVVLALTLNTSSYFAEVFRAGIGSIPYGLIEAGRSTGLSFLQVMRHIIVPQAVRNMAPDLITNILETIKVTSIASVVALPELLRMARIAQGNTYSPTPLIAAALIYIVLLLPIVKILNRLEKKAY